MKTASSFSGFLAASLVFVPGASARHEARVVERVSVWYVPTVEVPSPRFTLPPVTEAGSVDERLRRIRSEYERGFCRRARDPFVARMTAEGIRVVYASRFAPAAVVEGSAHAIASLRQRKDVRRVWAPIAYVAEQDSSRRTIRADAIERLPRAVTGKGVRQCVLERDAVQAANPYLNVAAYFRSQRVYSNHPTAVAGIIASSHAKLRGIAPGVTLLSANAGSFTEADVLRASDWAIRQGANAINASFGGQSSGVLRLLDNYYDHVVRHLLVNFIKGAGNNGIRGGGYVVTPGLGFNSITVGNSNDAKTALWSDDTMHPSSGHRDPVTGHPKPEVVAPGSNLTGLKPVSPWTGTIGSGGSFAGPQGNAVAALLMERDPVLKLHPEAIKAVLMATAWHKIESPLIGDRDGAGQLHALAADRVVQAKPRLRHGMLTPTSFDANGHFDLRVPVEAFSEVRAVVSWTSDPGSAHPYPNNVLKMDVDLVVLDPTGKQVAISRDAKRGFEMVRFIPSAAGPHTFRLVRTRFAGTKEPYALAVSQIHDTRVTTIDGPATVALDKNTSFTLEDTYHAGWPYVAVASFQRVGPGLGVALGNRRVPLVPDVLTAVSLTSGGFGIFTSYAGLLDAAGLARLQVRMPPIASLVGLELAQVGLVLDPTSGLVIDVTAPFVSKITP